MLIYYLTGLLTTYIIYLLISPLIRLLILKFKYGDKVEIYYFPLLGLLKFHTDGVKYHGDESYFKRQIIKKNPNAKVLITNFLQNIVYVFVDSQSIKTILTEHENFQKHDMILFNDILFRKALLYTEGKRWRNQRNIMGHQFKFETFKDRVSYIKNVVRDVFERQIKEDQEIKIIDVCGEVTGQVVSLTFFGEDVNEKLINGVRPTEVVKRIISDILTLSLLNFWTIFRVYIFKIGNSIDPEFLFTNKELKLKKDLIILREYIRDIINCRIQNFEDFEKKGNQDFLQVYIREMKKQPDLITVEEIIQQYLTFFFAGMDTTSTLVGMACYCLAIYPEVQTKLRKHIQGQFINFDEIQLSDLSKLSYLTAFIEEVLRLYPPAEAIFPRMSVKNQFINNIFVPAGTSVDVGIVPLMNHPKYFEKPDEFIVERWLEEKRPENFSYIPFSGGGRNCIGQHMAQIEAKIMLIYLVNHFHIYPDPARKLVRILQPLYIPQDQRIVRFTRIK